MSSLKPSKCSATPTTSISHSRSSDLGPAPVAGTRTILVQPRPNCAVETVVASTAATMARSTSPGQSSQAHGPELGQDQVPNSICHRCAFSHPLNTEPHANSMTCPTCPNASAYGSLSRSRSDQPGRAPARSGIRAGLVLVAPVPLNCLRRRRIGCCESSTR